jgi:hypothetical protein
MLYPAQPTFLKTRSRQLPLMSKLSRNPNERETTKIDQNYSNGSRFEISLLTRFYAMTDSETISDSRVVMSVISGLAFSNVKIVWVEVDFVVRLVLLRRTGILHCTE